MVEGGKVKMSSKEKDGMEGAIGVEVRNQMQVDVVVDLNRN